MGVIKTKNNDQYGKRYYMKRIIYIIYIINSHLRQNVFDKLVYTSKTSMLALAPSWAVTTQNSPPPAPSADNEESTPLTP